MTWWATVGKEESGKKLFVSVAGPRKCWSKVYRRLREGSELLVDALELEKSRQVQCGVVYRKQARQSSMSLSMGKLFFGTVRLINLKQKEARRQQP